MTLPVPIFSFYWSVWIQVGYSGFFFFLFKEINRMLEPETASVCQSKVKVKVKVSWLMVVKFDCH